MKNLNVVVITIAGLGFLGFGIVLLLWPEMGLSGIGIQAKSLEAEVELRAFYGGLEIGLGLLLLTCLPAERQGFGLQISLATNGGIGLARGASMLALGTATPFLWFAVAWEVTLAALAMLALRSKTPTK